MIPDWLVFLIAIPFSLVMFWLMGDDDGPGRTSRRTSERTSRRTMVDMSTGLSTRTERTCPRDMKADSSAKR